MSANANKKKVILNYVPGRGRAEIIRLTLVATGVEVNFTIISKFFNYMFDNIKIFKSGYKKT